MSIRVKQSRRKPEPIQRKSTPLHVVERRMQPGYLGVEWDREWIQVAAYREDVEAMEAIGRLEEEYAGDGYEFRWRTM